VSHCLTAPIPYCLTASLPFCLSDSLSHCLTFSLPRCLIVIAYCLIAYCLISLLSHCLTASVPRSLHTPLPPILSVPQLHLTRLSHRLLEKFIFCRSERRKSLSIRLWKCGLKKKLRICSCDLQNWTCILLRRRWNVMAGSLAKSKNIRMMQKILILLGNLAKEGLQGKNVIK
jgi:hypothetical protein